MVASTATSLREPTSSNTEGESLSPTTTATTTTDVRTSAREETKPRTRKKRRDRTDVAQESLTAAEQTTDVEDESPMPPLPALPPIDGIPILLMRFGVRVWRQHRQRQPEEEQRRLDDAMAEMMWQLADTLPDGVLLQSAPDAANRVRSPPHSVAP